MVFQPQTVTAPDLGSVANSTPPVPPVPTFFWIFVSLSPRTYPLTPPPYFTPLLRFSLSLFVPTSPPPSRPGTEQLSTWTTPLPTGLHHSSALPSHAGRPKEFLARACYCLPLSSSPPSDSLDLRPGPFHPHGFSCPRFPSSLFLRT